MTNNNSQHKTDHFKNFVVEDGIIKEQSMAENRCRLMYDQKWGHVKQFNEFCADYAREKGIHGVEYKAMTTRRKGSKLPAVSTWVPASSGLMPRTSAGEIGWRSSQKECNLEIMGPLYISPRFTMATEGFAHYKNIFLG